MEEDESEMMQGEGWRERASCMVLKRAKSSADCWFVAACFGSGKEE